MKRRVSQLEAIAVLDSLGAVREGHFISTSGRHLSAYVQKELPTMYPSTLRILAGGIAHVVHRFEIDVIAAPPMGALGLGIMVAEELEKKYIYLEEVNAELVVKRPVFQSAVKRAQVGIVEDIFTSGKTSRDSVRAIESADGSVVYVTGLYNRGGLTAENIGVPNLLPLITKSLPDWPDMESCELCAQGVPITLNVGHGADFQKTHSDYHGGFITVLG